MSRRRHVATATRDPAPYSGPLRRADGVPAFNQYFWPMPEDNFHPADLRPRVNAAMLQWSVVPLNNGAWIVDGFTWSQQYLDRASAMRVAAARVLRRARAARHAHGVDGMDPDAFEGFVVWVYSILERPAPPICPVSQPTRVPVDLLEIMEAD
jgi:hypothetical protein